jgi:ABC-type uncharacterized transport system substrate-binding protein
MLTGDTVLVVMESENERHRGVLAAFKDAVKVPSGGNGVMLPIRAIDVSQWAAEERRATPMEEPALIVTVGTRAAQQVLRRGDQTPVLKVLLPDIAHRQLETDRAASPQRVVAAIVLDQPVERQLAIAATLLPDARQAGALFRTDDDPAMARYRSEAMRFGLVADPERVDSEDEVSDHIEALIERSDVVLALYDHRLFRPVTAKWMLYLAFQERRPIIGFSNALLKAGAVAAVYSTPEQIGLHAAETVKNWLSGAPPQAVQSPAYYNIGINRPVARALGIEVPGEDEFGARVRQRLEDTL